MRKGNGSISRDTILRWSVRTTVLVKNALTRTRIMHLIVDELNTPISSKYFQRSRKLLFSISFKLNKLIKHLTLVIQWIKPSKLTEIINEKNIEYIRSTYMFKGSPHITVNKRKRMINTRVWKRKGSLLLFETSSQSMQQEGLLEKETFELLSICRSLREDGWPNRQCQRDSS